MQRREIRGQGSEDQGRWQARPSIGPSRAERLSDETRSTRDLRNSPPAQRSPTVDIIDEGSEFQVQLELPGVKKDDLDIMVTDRAIVIEASANPEMDEGVVMVNERGPVSYRRAIHLPAQIDTKNCKAKLKDGVLTLDVPKKEPTEGARRVEIAYG